MSEGQSNPYNERLFETSRLRRYYHVARFEWFKELCKTGKIRTNSILELGCFDGRLLDYCPEKPRRYVGVDANVEGGFALATSKFANDPTVTLIESTQPADLASLPSRSFDTIVALETLEHLPPSSMDQYLDEFARLASGHLVFSVPNEKGAVFLFKFLGKLLVFGGGSRYSWSEATNATLGRMDRVARDQHKGFDYDALISQVKKRFDIVSVSGLPFSWLPPSLNLTVAVLAKQRR